MTSQNTEDQDWLFKATEESRYFDPLDDGYYPKFGAEVIPTSAYEMANKNNPEVNTTIRCGHRY